MEKIKVILVDDETDSREVLLSLLQNYSGLIEVTGQASSVSEAYDIIRKERPQLVFLDIQMPKAGGFDLLKKFEEVPFEVVFVTSFDKYAINAIKFSALDYLLKPVEIDDLDFAIRKALKSISMKSSSGKQIVNLLHSLDTDKIDRKIAVHSNDKVKLLSEWNILIVEGDGSFCHVTMVNNEVFTTARNLKDFEEYFETTNNFVRISKDTIINIHHIRDYSKGEPCTITMMNGKTFDVARRKKTEVLEKLKR
jgi:two-component system LytT family response regulator